MPKPLAIAYKTVKRGPMNEVLCANVTQPSGVEKDVFGRPGKRQVTVLSKIQWQQACNSIEADLPWTTRRANLLVMILHLAVPMFANIYRSVNLGDWKSRVRPTL